MLSFNFKTIIFFGAIIGVCISKTTSGEHSQHDPPQSHEKSLSGSSSHNSIPENNETLWNETTGEGHQGHEIIRFAVATMDFERIQTPIIMGLWIFLACLGKIAFNMTPKLSHMFPESCMLILMGLVIGGILVYAKPHSQVYESPLTPYGFFIFLLPPIILDAGYFMPNRLFFDHLGTILMFAVWGTIWNALTIGISLYALALTGLFGTAEFPILHVFLFSSLISAVDPVAVLTVFEEVQVDDVLFILVFGESLLNDGVTVVLYHIFEGFSEIGEENIIVLDVIYGLISFLLVALGGTFIGILWGFLAAFITRFTYKVRVIEPMFVFVTSYLSYLNAELFHWSGILAITFCGITMKNYTEQNMSQKSQTTTKYAMKMMASSAETVIFLFLGVATTVLKVEDCNVWFIVFTILFCSVYRVIGTIILSEVCNTFRARKIDFVEKFIMSYGGLRGAVAFALAITINAHHVPLAPVFVTTTIAMVFFTVFLQGITIKPLVEFLGVKKSDKRTLNMNERLHGRSFDYIMIGIEDIIGKFGNYYVRGWFKRMNHNYLQPLLVRNVKAKDPKLFETLSHLKMQDALNYMSQKPTSIADLESLSQVLHSNVYSRNSVKEWNLDTGELEYKPGDRDLNEARFHHILADNYKLVSGRRQSTYKRHAVCDEELETQTDFQNKMLFRARQVAMQSVKYRKAIKKPNELRILEVNRPSQANGSAVRLRNDYLEETSRDNPSYDDDEGLFMTKKKVDFMNMKRLSTKGPSIAETTLPWKRFTEGDAPTSNTKMKRSMSITGEEVIFDSHPTMAEILLPWKRNEDSETQDSALRQSEFPSWATNKDYADYYSPTNTLLGKITGIDDTKPSVKEIFDRRQSCRDVYIHGEESIIAEDAGLPSLRNSAKDHIYAKKGSLRTDPTRRRQSLIDDPRKRKEPKDESANRRASLKDIKDMLHLRVTHSLLNDHNKNDHHPSRRSSSHDVGFDSLLNTVIEEEQTPKTSTTDYVINMNPDGDKPSDTRF